MSLDLSRAAPDVADTLEGPEEDELHDTAAVPEPDRPRRPPISDHDETEQAPGLPLRLRIVAGVALAVTALYMIACAIYNLPSSTVKVRVDGTDKALMQPWFEQDWQLFAPNPATSNAHLMVSMHAVDASGAAITLAPFDAQYPIEDLQKNSPYLPTKLPGATLAAQERFASYQKQLLVIQTGGGPDQAALHVKLDRIFRPTLDALDRLISYEAHQKYPNAVIQQVQATFTTTAMTPFSARFVTPVPKEPTKTSLQTTWFPYISGVGSR